MDASKIMKSFCGMEVYDEAARLHMAGFTTAGTGSAYTVSVKGIDSLVKGASFTMIPHVNSTSERPTVNVNGFGTKTIRQRLSSSNYESKTLEVGFLVEGKPVHLTYDGVYWVVDIPAPDAGKMHGIVPIANGGTGVNVSSNTGALFKPTIQQNYLSIGTLPVNSGGTGATNAKTALNNLGVTWGTGAAPSKGTPNTIYIQIN